MKNMILEVTAGIGVLIGIYLFVANFQGTVAIINAIADPSVKMVKTLQGRG
jgi:hypothetical protein